MDPDANLAEQRRLAEKILHDEWTNEEADRLASLVQALDEWIQGGGFPPAAWRKGVDLEPGRWS